MVAFKRDNNNIHLHSDSIIALIVPSLIIFMNFALSAIIIQVAYVYCIHIKHSAVESSWSIVNNLLDYTPG